MWNQGRGQGRGRGKGRKGWGEGRRAGNGPGSVSGTPAALPKREDARPVEGRTTTDSELDNPTPGRVAVPVKVPELNAPLESKFGRAAFLLLVDPTTLAFEVVENPAREARGGAGIAAAELLGKKKVTGVIAEKFGPKAQEALTAAAIPMYRCPANVSVREAVGRFTAGELTTAGEGDEGIRGRL